MGTKITATNPKADPFLVFYSWQSDSPSKTNRSAIKKALSTAKGILKKEFPTVQIDIDEATRKTPGSPNVPITILKKIRLSDAFFCDVTTINKAARKVKRKTPNPNVMFELGYAVAHLGWDRIVMLFNKEHGKTRDLPFDFDRQRIATYTYSGSRRINKKQIADLESLNTAALREIIKKQPPKPNEDLSPKELKRKRDVAQLKLLMQTIHIGVLDSFISSMPHMFEHRIFYFWEGFNAAMKSRLFHLYDKTAYKYAVEICKSWDVCLSHSQQYHTDQSGRQEVYSAPKPAEIRESERVYKLLTKNTSNLRKAFDGLVALIRTKYIDIDVSETSKVAWAEYAESQRHWEDRNRGNTWNTEGAAS
jgi:hypothetical protein